MARWMADELDATRLRVVLVPDQFLPGGVRRLRAVEEENPEWYRCFCRAFPARRRRERRRHLPDTAIKRRHTLRGLRELADGRCESVYAMRLLGYVAAEYDRVQDEQAQGLVFFEPRPMTSLALLEMC